MTQFLAPIINNQWEDVDGATLSGGTISVYYAGTSTPAPTTSDQAGAVANSWPIVLNILGVNSQGSVWLAGGSAYKFVIKDVNGVVQRTIDNVSGMNDTTVTTDQWVVYLATPTYVSATSFTLVGDQTQTFQVGRRVRTVNTGGTVYSTITGSVYGAPNTTVTVVNDSGVLDSGLSQVSYGVTSVLNTSQPGGITNFGQCRLVKSGANLLLTPFNGNRITINGSICLIPPGGVTLAPTALTPLTLYFIYAYLNGATLTLEASTTTHAQNAATGVEQKTGDPTRTLVGMARPIAGPLWQDATNQRFVSSWFNPQPIEARAVLAANQVISSAAYGEISATLRTEFLIWGGKSAQFSFQGSMTANTAAAVYSTQLSIDSSTATSESYADVSAPAINSFMNPYCSLVVTPSEGYHFVSPLARQSGGATATYIGSGTSGARCVVSGIVQM